MGSWGEGRGRRWVPLVTERISDQKEKAFFDLAERFRSSKNPEETKQLGDELGRFVFGVNNDSIV
jgi:hypothetical protein